MLSSLLEYLSIIALLLLALLLTLFSFTYSTAIMIVTSVILSICLILFIVFRLKHLNEEKSGSNEVFFGLDIPIPDDNEIISYSSGLIFILYLLPFASSCFFKFFAVKDEYIFFMIVFGYLYIRVLAVLAIINEYNIQPIIKISLNVIRLIIIFIVVFARAGILTFTVQDAIKDGLLATIILDTLLSEIQKKKHN